VGIRAGACGSREKAEEWLEAGSVSLWKMGLGLSRHFKEKEKMNRTTWTEGKKAEAKKKSLEWHDKYDNGRNQNYSYCRMFLGRSEVWLYVHEYIKGDRSWVGPSLDEGTKFYELTIYIGENNKEPVYKHPDYSFDLELAKRDLEDIYLNLYPPLTRKK